MRFSYACVLALLLFRHSVNAQNHIADTIKNKSNFITTSVKVNGLVNHTLNLSVTDLEQMSAAVINDFDVIGKGGVVKSHLKSFKGVLLKNVLNKADVNTKTAKEPSQLYIVASASDGFKVVFSWAEIFNTPLGDKVFVVYEEEGKAIEKSGKIVLFTTADKINGMRHVKWLSEITVKKAE